MKYLVNSLNLMSEWQSPKRYVVVCAADTLLNYISYAIFNVYSLVILEEKRLLIGY